MAYLPKAMVNGVSLTDSAVTYYTVPSSTRGIIKKATFTNDSAEVVTVTINIVPYEGSVGYANRIIKEHAIPAGATWSCLDIQNHELETGSFISMLASVTATIGCRISGYEVI